MEGGLRSGEAAATSLQHREPRRSVSHLSYIHFVPLSAIRCPLPHADTRHSRMKAAHSPPPQSTCNQSQPTAPSPVSYTRSFQASISAPCPAGWRSTPLPGAAAPNPPAAANSIRLRVMIELSLQTCGGTMFGGVLESCMGSRASRGSPRPGPAAAKRAASPLCAL